MASPMKPKEAANAAAASSSSLSGAVPPPPPTSTTLNFGRILLDISNSVLPLDKLSPTPSSKDGLSAETELEVRSLACDLVQIAGKLLRLPQVAMATACVLFHRFYYAKSMVRLPFDVVAMAALGLASKIEESPRRTRDIINVFKHIRQIRSGKYDSLDYWTRMNAAANQFFFLSSRPIQPMILDTSYIALKNQVIKAERRILKELGFCVHVKHPHKVYHIR